jgi:hypothetical protein
LFKFWPHLKTTFGIMFNIIVIETFYFGDVPRFLFNWAITILAWVFLPLYFLTPFWIVYNLKTTSNIPFWLLGGLVDHLPWNLQSSSFLNWFWGLYSFELFTCRPKIANHERRLHFGYTFPSWGWSSKGLQNIEYTFPTLPTHLLGTSWATFTHLA